jgi:hypothetical protein
MITRGFTFALIVCWCVLPVERPALAYLDPGSGSMLLQVLLGGVAGVAVIAKLYWGRLLSLFGIRRDPPKE